MKQLGTSLERIGCCPCFGFRERKLVLDKYDFHFRVPLSADIEEISDVDLRATLGRQIVSKLLSPEAKSKYKGRFIAVTYTGKILAICDTLEVLNQRITKMHLEENYYIERVGYSTITQI
jgi:hypothetical protein